MEFRPAGLDLVGCKFSIRREDKLNNSHLVLVNMTLHVFRKLFNVHEIRQSGPELWVFDIARLLLESEICIHCENETVQPPVTTVIEG